MQECFLAPEWVYWLKTLTDVFFTSLVAICGYLIVRITRG